MSAYVLDITERHHAEEALRESEQRYRFLAEALPQVVWVAAPDGTTEFLNSFWHEFTGMQYGASLEEHWPALVHPDDHGMTVDGWRKACTAGEANEMEFRLRRAADGAYRWMLGRYHPIRSESGQIVKWIGTAVDIDDRKRAEEKIRESEARAQRQLLELDTLHATAPVGMCIVDPALRYLRINERLAAMHGASAADHIGRSIHEVAPQVAHAIEPLYRRVLNEGRNIAQAEVRISGETGSEPRTWLVDLVPLEIGGELFGISSIVQDVTEQRAFEKKLRETQKLEAIGVLAGGVAHDFNNLLTGVVGNASLGLEIAGDSEPLAGRLRELLAAGESAADLTRQLLAYAGKGRFLIEPLDVSQLIERTHVLVRSSIPRNIDLRLELDNLLPPVEGDASQLQQLLMNLIINGAEAVGPDRPGSVSVQTRKQVLQPEEAVRSHVEPGEYVVIAVTDNGSGMDEETKSRTFDPFFTTKFTGRGLGLAAALGIVQGHRGVIQVDTGPGKGSAFTVLLPAAAGESKRKAPSLPGRVSHSSGATVLIVDDEPVVRNFARNALTMRGFGALSAADGEDAVRIYLEKRPSVDLVLMDVTMPLMDGVETTRHLRAIDPDVRILVMSGHEEKDALRRFDGLGVDGFIQKPHSVATLVGKIEEVLQRPKARRAL